MRPYRRRRGHRPRAAARTRQVNEALPVNVAAAATLANIGPGQCRYVLGKPAGLATRFCGHPVEPGWPWCPDHLALIYVRGDVLGTSGLADDDWGGV